MTFTYVNLTPHTINFNDGRIFQASGQVARVKTSFSEINDDIAETIFGEVENLPPQQEGTVFIVSALVMERCQYRSDVVAPATGHPQSIRNEKGHIVSVPCFTKNWSI